jgi:hypothetical protein
MLRRVCFLTVLSLLFFVGSIAKAQSDKPANPSPAGKDVVLKASEITVKLFPTQVFYRGKLAPVQIRNTGGVHFADGLYVLAGLVDTAGYSTSVREKYQGYLLVEAPLEIGGQQLKPGAYGFGFVADGKFVVTDLGGHDVFEIASSHDAQIHRPVPLQVTAGANMGTYCLYRGRDYVEFHRAD